MRPSSIQLITTGQPTTNPRLVKECDALSEAGYDVRVLCVHWAAWADGMDEELLGSRSWKCAYVAGHPKRDRMTYAWTRMRHSLARRVASLPGGAAVATGAALDRAVPELLRAARRMPADLYVAHNLGALPGAVAAARRYGARVGFDAEDFHSGMRLYVEHRGAADPVIERTERACIPQCDYVTAASPGIAEAYARKYDIPEPSTILNVFPLADRPPEFRMGSVDTPLNLFWFSQTIGPHRGLEDAVLALGRLSPGAAKLHLMGAWQAGYKERLFALAGQVGLGEGSIVWHPPEAPEFLIRAAAQYDVGLALEQPVSENRDICLTNKIFVCLLAGSAIAATATRAQTLLMDSIPGAGLTYHPGDIGGLEAILRQWILDRDALEAARRRSWDWGTRAYNWDLEKQKLLRLVEAVLGSGPDAARGLPVRQRAVSRC